METCRDGQVMWHWPGPSAHREDEMIVSQPRKVLHDYAVGRPVYRYDLFSANQLDIKASSKTIRFGK
jgi:hypothetical protein